MDITSHLYIIYCKLEFICEGIFCEVLRMFENAKNAVAKDFNGYMVIIVVMNFCKGFLIAKIFQHKIIPVYGIGFQSTV